MKPDFMEEEIEELELKEKAVQDPKQKWIMRIIRSMKSCYRRCPYFDTKSGQCLIKFTDEDKKCRRDGKYEGCAVLERFLASRYDEIKRSGKPLPYDFRDLALV